LEGRNNSRYDLKNFSSHHLSLSSTLLSQTLWRTLLLLLAELLFINTSITSFHLRSPETWSIKFGIIWPHGNMRYHLLLYSILTLTSSSSAQPSVIPGAYILETTPTINVASSSFSASYSHVQAFHTAATDLQYTVRYEFNNPEVFLGLSIQVTNTTRSDEEIRKYLSTLPGVINVTPVGVVQSPTPPDEEESPAVSDVEVLISASPSKSNPKLRGPFKGGDLSSSLRMGAVDKLHKIGIRGKYITIGIIDDGIDYHHPAFGGKFGPGNKIAGGHAFVNDEGHTADKKDPLTKCPKGLGHGTHVAG
jgi:subtilisin family serine protease